MLYGVAARSNYPPPCALLPLIPSSGFALFFSFNDPPGGADADKFPLKMECAIALPQNRGTGVPSWAGTLRYGQTRGCLPGYFKAHVRTSKAHTRGMGVVQHQNCLLGTRFRHSCDEGAEGRKSSFLRVSSYLKLQLSKSSKK